MRKNSIRTLLLVVLAQIVAVPVVVYAAEGAPAKQLQPLAFLAGYCWSGPFADGKSTDEHCYEWVYGGKFLRDRHIVRGGAKPYQGETLYFVDGATSTVEYIYFNSDGGVSRGRLEVKDDALTFPAERYTEGTTTREFSTSLARSGEDGYRTVTRELKDGSWTEAWRVEYRRGAPIASADWLKS